MGSNNGFFMGLVGCSCFRELWMVTWDIWRGWNAEDSMEAGDLIGDIS
jgi:hypothetical protein